ncbi:MAG TPA: hypothetical protein DD723_03340 [Candidatus Omnitrophica bacterium]|nr:MAG: hypothetical protein A2Z81_00935 [Omnitrophica WOR_2 bacterium GWA2_45_18]OGX19394.1 MAG: hypothetical protein A2Y04_00365 [Omnitrophica WOR_2 bacterium GWC2_45_7]HBR14564.1 hypothetical protein [Candidatus Omnitrophota bacterium]
MPASPAREVVRWIKTTRLYARVGLTRMNPRKAFVMLRYWILTHLFKKDIPWLIEFSVTYRCQASCKHCSVSNYFPEANKSKELSTEKVKDILKQAVTLGIPKIDFFGGEPLLRADIIELVTYGEGLGLYTSITTNAWQLTYERVKQLKKAGISCINVSIDSPQAEEHDRSRGVKGMHQRAVEGITYCRQEGIPCIVSTYATRRRIQNFAAGEKDDSVLSGILRLSRKLEATGVRILFPIIAGEWVKAKENEFTDEEKRGIIENIDPSFAFIEGAYSVVKKNKVCQALSGKMLNISPYGDLQLCVAFTNTFGNVKEQSLETLMKAMRRHPIYQKNKDGSCCSTTELKV